MKGWRFGMLRSVVSLGGVVIARRSQWCSDDGPLAADR